VGGLPVNPGTVLSDEGYYEMTSSTTIYPIVVIDPTALRVNFSLIEFPGSDSVNFQRLKESLPVVYPRGKASPNYSTPEYTAKVITDKAAYLTIRALDASGAWTDVGHILAKSAGVWRSSNFPLPYGSNKLRLTVVMESGDVTSPLVGD
jgi:hypothetical protein